MQLNFPKCIVKRVHPSFKVSRAAKASSKSRQGIFVECTLQDPPILLVDTTLAKYELSPWSNTEYKSKPISSPILPSN